MDNNGVSSDVPVTQVPEIDYYRLKLDTVYFRIRTRFDIGCIEIGLWNKMKLVEIFRGHRCQDLYTYIINKHMLSNLHCAYLGKELKKAEMSMATGATYYQE